MSTHQVIHHNAVVSSSRNHPCGLRHRQWPASVAGPGVLLFAGGLASRNFACQLLETLGIRHTFHTKPRLWRPAHDRPQDSGDDVPSERRHVQIRPTIGHLHESGLHDLFQTDDASRTVRLSRDVEQTSHINQILQNKPRTATSAHPTRPRPTLTFSRRNDLAHQDTTRATSDS